MEILEFLVMGLVLAWAVRVLWRSLTRKGPCPGCPGNCPGPGPDGCGSAGICEKDGECCPGENGASHGGRER